MLYAHARHVTLNFEFIIFGFTNLKLSFLKTMNCGYFDILRKLNLKMYKAVCEAKNGT